MFVLRSSLTASCMMVNGKETTEGGKTRSEERKTPIAENLV